MGRKKGQQQRTKGNVLPSSSGRSADLLAKESETSGFGFFESSQFTGFGNVPELAGLDAIASNEFRTVLKKLYKRDVTTKLKALNEFSVLCSSSKQHEVLTVLPYWPRIYNRLFEDSDRRVRENSQKAMNSLAVASGKNLALQLKNIMGCWFVSQCDPYAPSALVAEASIGQAFTGGKKVEAFAFCRIEILKCVTHYLFGPQARKEKGSDQEKNNYYRIMSSCLESLSLFVQTVVKHKPVNGEIEDIIKEPRFWKLQKHSSVSVRGGFYSVIEALCIVSSDLVHAHLAESCKSVFHRLDESNVAVCKPLYAAAVALISKCDGWHEVVDIQKGVVPGLCSILKSGCYGLWAYVLPSLLPILAKIPISVDLYSVFLKVFDAMKVCLNHEQVKPSKHGSELAITAYFEILLLCVSRIANEVSDPDVKEKLPDMVLKENVLYLLEESLAGRSNKSSVRLIYRQQSLAIHSWVAKTVDAASDPLYCHLSDGFWKYVSVLMDRYLLNENYVVSSKLLVQFFDEMIHVAKQTGIPRRSVKFEEAPLQCSSSISQTALTSSHQVLDNVNKIVGVKLLPFPWKVSEEAVSVYKDIFEKLGNPGLFNKLFEHSGCARDQIEGDKVASLIERDLLKEIERIIGLEEKCSKRLLIMLSDIVFYALKHCKCGEVFPFDVESLVETDTTKPYFIVTLRFILNLERYAETDPTVASWLGDLMNDINNPLWPFLSSLSQCVSVCTCSFSDSASIVDVEEAWKLLESLLTRAYTMRDGKVTFLSGQGGFHLICQVLLSNMESSRSCTNCYSILLCKVSTVMLSCLKTRRDLDASPLNKDGESVWLRLMTEGLRTHCFCANGNALLVIFSEFLSLAVSGQFPFIASNSLNIADYIGTQARWMKGKLLSEDISDYSSVSDNLKTLLVAVFEKVGISTQSGVAFLSNFLPSVEEWKSARGRFSDVILSGELESFEDFQIDGMRSTRYFSLLRFLQEVLIHVIKTSSLLGTDGEEDCELFECLLTLAEELAIGATVSGDLALAGNFISLLGPKFDSNFRALLLERSMGVGGIWPHCSHLYGPHFGHNEWDVALDKFHTCCESSELSFELFQTMTAVLEFLPQEKLHLGKLLSQLDDIDAEAFSPSEMYLFSFVVMAFSMNSYCSEDSLRHLLEIVIKWRNVKDDLFAFDEEALKDARMHILCLNSSVACLFTLCVKRLAESLSESQWDFILCALLSWMESISTSFGEVSDKSSVIVLLKNSCILLQEVNGFMCSPTAKEDPTVPNNLLHEWSEFFSTQINESVVKIFLSPNFHSLPISPAKWVLKCIQQMGKSAASVGAELKPKLSPDSSLSPEIQTILNHLCPLLRTKTGSRSRQALIICTTYAILRSTLGSIADPNLSSPPESLLNVLKLLSSDVESLFIMPDSEVVKSGSLSDDDGSEVDEVEEDDTAVNYKMNILENAPAVLGFFLGWKLLINLTRHINTEKKAVYIDSLMKGKDVNLVEDLLPKIFKVMVGKKSLFKTDPELYFENEVHLDHLEHVAASIYRDFLVRMPAASRSWFNDLAKAVRSRVDKFTSTHVSPVLIEEEFKAVQVTKQQQAVEGMEIIARPAAREVHATYKLNEIQMEIAVCLSPNHPLGAISVKTEKRAGVVMGQWRYWLLQITMFLQYQNGGITDGLLLWKDKVDKRFEGIEECMICFSVVHGSSQSLPKLKCKTCKKKYHAECLYKWFDTSNNSTCPLCRSPMIFR